MEQVNDFVHPLNSGILEFGEKVFELLMESRGKICRLAFSFSSFFNKKVLWGHWYPCFGPLVASALGLKIRVDS